MLQFKVQLNESNETEIVFQYGESKESLEEQVFDGFVDNVENDGYTLSLARAVQNGVVTVKLQAIEP